MKKEKEKLIKLKEKEKKVKKYRKKKNWWCTYARNEVICSPYFK